MPPVLKVLSLVTTILCVVLFFGIGALDHRVGSKRLLPSFYFHTIDKNFKGGSNLSSSGTDVSRNSSSLTITNSSSIDDVFQVVTLTNRGTYFDYSASTTIFLNLRTLETIGGPYYKDNENYYYLATIVNDCTDVKEKKLVQLAVDGNEPLSVSSSENSWLFIAKNSKNAFVNFYKISSADTVSFSYVGIADSKGEGLEFTDNYWYKDTHKVFTITAKVNTCKGIRISEETATTLQQVDSPTFEYIGMESTDSHFTYAKDKNYFYDHTGILSSTTTPGNCHGDFFKECLPLIRFGTTTVQ